MPTDDKKITPDVRNQDEYMCREYVKIYKESARIFTTVNPDFWTRNPV